MIISTLAFLATLTWLGFCAWYSVRAKWWHGPVGRNTFLVSLLFTVFLARNTALRLMNDTPDMRDGLGWFLFGVLLYLFTIYVGARRIYFVEKFQRQGEQASIEEFSPHN